MKLEWDDNKAKKNRRKHGIGLDDAKRFEFDEALIFVDDSEDYGEERFVGIGFIGNKIHYLVFTTRDESVRVISLRRATKEESKGYVEYIEKGY